jgi:hypothetical protein
LFTNNSGYDWGLVVLLIIRLTIECDLGAGCSMIVSDKTNAHCTFPDPQHALHAFLSARILQQIGQFISFKTGMEMSLKQFRGNILFRFH